MPVFTAEEMRRLDRRAIDELGIPGTTLMENAGRGATQAILSHFGSQRRKRVVVCCGKGNNGGDGFVVASRLKAARAFVSVFLIGRGSEVKGDAAAKLAAYRKAGGTIHEMMRGSDLATLDHALASADLVVDALLGTGLTGQAAQLYASAIEAINHRT